MARGRHIPGTKPEEPQSLIENTQANVMLAYSIPEAQDLLESKLTAAQQSLDNCEEDLDFLREQITVCVDDWVVGPGTFFLWSLLIKFYRRSRSRPQECTIGTSRSAAKTRTAEKNP